MSIQSIISTILQTQINEFIYALSKKYTIDFNEITNIWEECIHKKQKNVDVLKRCKHIYTSGQLKGIDCGKWCEGEYCSSHRPRSTLSIRSSPKSRVTEEEQQEKYLEQLEKILQNIGVLDWDSEDTEFSKYFVLKCTMHKNTLEKLINKNIQPNKEYNEVDAYPFVFYIIDESLGVSYLQGDEEENIHVHLKIDTLQSEIKKMVKIMKRLK